MRGKPAQLLRNQGVDEGAEGGTGDTEGDGTGRGFTVRFALSTSSSAPLSLHGDAPRIFHGLRYAEVDDSIITIRAFT